jgi:hypothetical protein
MTDPRALLDAYAAREWGSPAPPFKPSSLPWRPTVDDAVRAEVADELEAAGSLLCDCEGFGPATCPSDRSKQMPHHCDCAAVAASRTIRRGLTHTRHAVECGHPKWMEEDRD